PERIVTITGQSEVIFKAFAMIAEKFEEDILASMINSTVTSRPPVTLRLVFPASQCGSLIGKGGSKIKEISGPSTGAQVQVAGDLLPDSTERAVTISGTPRAITQCVNHICTVMLEVRERATLVICSNLNMLSVPQAFTIPGQFAIPPQDVSVTHFTTPLQYSSCIIGRQGSKINEIRQMSGAQIKIAGATDGSAVRHVTITGSPANISVAQYLISASLGFSQYTPSVSASTASSMAVLAAPPSAINVHSPSSVPSIPSAHYAFPVSSLLGMKTVPLLAVHTATSAGLPAGFTPYTAKFPTSSSIKKSERQKFAPY
uniref:Zgc:110045 n=1 Tax=Sinocyclocheilus anshuiensis TaxID=1608454 RepID=A0A671LMC1_9TELE